MCGLTGYIGLGEAPPTATDASATWHEGRAALGHTRLATLDLTGGRQPLLLERGGRTDLAVVFTGEVYNHAGLRRELAGRGHRFRTRSDGEVVLHAVDAWGPDAPARLEGMFAYAAWEPARRRLTLGRDRLGIKPLCYAQLDLDPARMNPHGGSIALGEPYGAAGARLTTTALTSLRHDDHTTALISVVAAGGQGMAMVLERLT